MFKHIVLLIALSVAIVTALSYAQQVIQQLLNAHDWILQVLSDVFTGGQAGSLFKGLLALLAIPVLIAAVPTAIYWLIRRHWFPYFMEIVWVIWLVQAGALIVYQTAS